MLLLSLWRRADLRDEKASTDEMSCDGLTCRAKSRVELQWIYHRLSVWSRQRLVVCNAILSRLAEAQLLSCLHYSQIAGSSDYHSCPHSIMYPRDTVACFKQSPGPQYDHLSCSAIVQPATLGCQGGVSAAHSCITGTRKLEGSRVDCAG